MSDRIQHFLLVCDHVVGHLIHTESYGEDADAALVAYSATEAEYGDQCGHADDDKHNRPAQLGDASGH